jgi:uncharacterized protein (DUF983 family)
MPPPMADEPLEIQHEEDRQELFGRGPSRTGMAVYEIVAITLAVLGAAVAAETIDSWSQWVVLGGIIVLVIGVMIALSPNRRGA